MKLFLPARRIRKRGLC